ncbi:MAG: CHAD domain-containing protein [Acidimicrobiia bacterium]
MPKTVDEVVAGAFDRAARRIRSHAPLLACADSGDELRRSRTALRRLRTDLRTLRPVTDRDEVDGLRAELAWAITVLGAVRDLDVIEAWLEAVAGPADRDLLDRLSVEIAKRRSAAEAQVVEMASGDRFAALATAIARGVHRPPVRDGRVGRKAAKLPEELMVGPARRLLTAVSSSTYIDNPEEEYWHDVRKAARTARYAAELLAPIAGRSLEKAAERFGDAQDVLGRYGEARLVYEWIASLDGEYAFAAGGLAAEAVTAQAASLLEWPRVWERARHSAKQML